MQQHGFMLPWVIVIGLVFSIALVGLYSLSGKAGFSSAVYDTVDSAQAAHASAARISAEIIDAIILDGKTPVGDYIADPDIYENDLAPTSFAQFDDDVYNSPDLIIDHGDWESRVDIDYVPLTQGFSWNNIKFGRSYQEAAGGGSTMGALSYRVHILTTGRGDARIETEGIYVVNPN